MDFQSFTSQHAHGALTTKSKLTLAYIKFMAKALLSLTKPGIIMGNVIAATGGFFLASKGQVDFILYLSTMLGITLVIAAGCVMNNIIDVDIDRQMIRTRCRALVVGAVGKLSASIWSLLLMIAGMTTLWLTTNVMTLSLAAFGLFAYVILYSAVAKRRSIHSTLVGSFSGATPPVMGYTAVTGQFNLTAALIFLAFCTWQMPHTYAISIYRRSDYNQCRIPLLPLVRGYKVARFQMMVYIGLFLLTILALQMIGSISPITTICMTALGSYWWYCTYQYRLPSETSEQATLWGKQLFILSIIAICLLSFLLTIDFVWSSFRVLG